MGSLGNGMRLHTPLLVVQPTCSLVPMRTAFPRPGIHCFQYEHLGGVRRHDYAFRRNVFSFPGLSPRLLSLAVRKAVLPTFHTTRDKSLGMATTGMCSVFQFTFLSLIPGTFQERNSSCDVQAAFSTGESETQ